MPETSRHRPARAQEALDLILHPPGRRSFDPGRVRGTRNAPPAVTSEALGSEIKWSCGTDGQPCMRMPGGYSSGRKTPPGGREMAAPNKPQLCLLTPPEFDLPAFRDQLAAVLDAQEVACVRLSMATRDAERLSRAADALRDAAHARDVAMVIESHLSLALDLGLDGVHLADGPRSVRKARKALGRDAIVGAFCRASRHDGMNAAEAGASYVAFGPVGASALGDGTLVETGLFAWWSEMIETPVVAEGDLDPSLAARLAPVTDFIGVGQEIWEGEDPAAALSELVRALG